MTEHLEVVDSDSLSAGYFFVFMHVMGRCASSDPPDRFAAYSWGLILLLHLAPQNIAPQEELANRRKASREQH